MTLQIGCRARVGGCSAAAKHRLHARCANEIRERYLRCSPRTMMRKRGRRDSRTRFPSLARFSRVVRFGENEGILVPPTSRDRKPKARRNRADAILGIAYRASTSTSTATGKDDRADFDRSSSFRLSFRIEFRSRLSAFGSSIEYRRVLGVPPSEGRKCDRASRTYLALGFHVGEYSLPATAGETGPRDSRETRTGRIVRIGDVRPDFFISRRQRLRFLILSILLIRPHLISVTVLGARLPQRSAVELVEKALIIRDDLPTTISTREAMLPSICRHRVSILYSLMFA